MRGHVLLSVASLSLSLSMAIVLAAPSRAMAQQPSTDDSSRARALFTRGVELADDERWGEAVEYFRRSRALVERPSTVFNLGNALLRLGRYNEAVRAFQDFLAMPNAQDAGQRAQAEQAMATARESLGRLVLTVSPDTAHVLVDGTAIETTGPTREIWLDPGDRSIRIVAEGREPETFTVSALPGVRFERRIDLAPARGPRSRISVRSTVASALIEIDGDRVGRGQVNETVTPGRHRIEVSATGYRTTHRDVDLDAGESLSVEAPLEPLGAAGGSGESGGILSSPIFWIVTGVVVVGAGVGIGVAVASGGAEDPYAGTTGVVLTGP